MNKTKVLLVSDCMLTPERMREEFRGLEKYDLEFSTIADHPNDTEEEFQARMLKLEVEGPEAVTPPKGLIEAVEDVDVLIVHFTVVTEAVIKAAKKLKLIAVLRGGWENVNTKAATENGIIVVNSPGRSGDAVADFTVGMLIAESKNIVRSSIAFRKGLWKPEFHNSSYLHNLRGRNVGIVGFGEIGKRVANRLKGFGVNILAYDPFLPKENILNEGCTPVDLPTLLKESDYITLHLRFTEKTKHIIGKNELAMMKPTAYLVNTARSGLVDEKALIEALRNKQIGGAALDVYDTEPLPLDSPFFELENVTITPHLAGTSVDTMHNSFVILGEELERYFRNEKLQFVKN